MGRARKFPGLLLNGSFAQCECTETHFQHRLPGIPALSFETTPKLVAPPLVLPWKHPPRKPLFLPPWCTSNISGAPSGYCHPLASLLYLPGHGQSPHMVFCLFLTSPWVRSSFQYLTLPVEPRTLTQFSSNSDPLLYARCHAGHEEIKDRACSLLLRNWQLNGISAFSEMDHASRSHHWEGRATSAPLLTPLQIDTAHPPYSSLPKWSKKWVEHDSAHTINLHGVEQASLCEHHFIIKVSLSGGGRQCEISFTTLASHILFLH